MLRWDTQRFSSTSSLSLQTGGSWQKYSGSSFSSSYFSSCLWRERNRVLCGKATEVAASVEINLAEELTRITARSALKNRVLLNMVPT